MSIYAVSLLETPNSALKTALPMGNGEIVKALCHGTAKTPMKQGSVRSWPWRLVVVIAPDKGKYAVIIENPPDHRPLPLASGRDTEKLQKSIKLVIMEGSR